MIFLCCSSASGPQPRLGEETDRTGHCIPPSKTRSPSRWVPRQKAGGRDHPAGTGGMRFFRFLSYLAGRVLLVRDELQRYSQEKSEKGDIHNWGLRLNCPSRSIGEAAAVTESYQFGAFFLLASHSKKIKGGGTHTIEKTFSPHRALNFPYLKETLGLA